MSLVPCFCINFHDFYSLGLSIKSDSKPILEFFGKLLIIKHSENLITSYAHLSKIYVHEGEIITSGQPIAEVGLSGKVTKSQLYFEIRQDNEALDPIPFLDS